MSHFLIAYPGNKRNEYKNFKDNINLDGLKNIIEPFAGTGAISFNIWLEHKDKFNYYLNDNSLNIYNIYKLIKEENINHILDKLNEVKVNIKNKDDFLKVYKSNYNIYEFIIINKLSSLRVGFYDERRKKSIIIKFTPLQLKFIEFIKSSNVFISNDDWFKPFDKFKDNKESLLFLDPPYISSYNDFYQDKNLNVYEYIFNNNINLFKCNIKIILEDMWINRLLFKDNNIICRYGKKYEISKKNTFHIIISN
jgi:site-specific DNA-adenine methylase